MIKKKYILMIFLLGVSPSTPECRMKDIKALFLFFKRGGILLLVYGTSSGPLYKSHLCP